MASSVPPAERRWHPSAADARRSFGQREIAPGIKRAPTTAAVEWAEGYRDVPVSDQMRRNIERFANGPRH